MKFQAEIITEYIRNIDNAAKQMTLEELAAAPPCRTYFDMGDQLKRYVHETFLEKVRAGQKEKDLLAQGGNIPDFENRRDRVSRRLAELIGGLPESDAPLEPSVTGIEQANGYHVEKIVFTARRDVYVTGNLYIPDGLEGKTGAVLFVCGHAKTAKAHPAYQRVCHLLAHAGLVAFIIDPVGQGERFSYLDGNGACKVEWGCPEHDYVGAQAIMLGHSTARYFVHDAMRAIDYLLTRPEVDSARIGVTGSSGGGTQTSLMMLLDKRIAAAAPGTFVTSLEAILQSGVVQDAEQIWNGLVAEGFDHDDILMAMAPKPVCVLACAFDFFPIEGTNASVASAKRFYELYGKAENLELWVDQSEHQYSPALAANAVDFFSRVFLDRPHRTPQKTLALLTEQQCRCTVSGQVGLDHPSARFLFDENREAFHRAEQNSLSATQRRQSAIAWLKERVYYNRRVCAPNLRRLAHTTVDGLQVETLLFWSGKHILSNMLCFRDSAVQPSGRITLAIWENGSSALSAHRDFLHAECACGNAVAILDLSGYGAQKPNRINTMPLYDFEGTLCGFSQHMIWQGDSLTALRAYEIIAAMHMLVSEMGYAAKDIDMFAEGYPCVPGAAAVLSCDFAPGKAVFRDIPSMERLLDERLYHAADMMSLVFPGAPIYFGISELTGWAEDRR